MTSSAESPLLPPAVPGQRRDIDGAAGRICYYTAGPVDAPPLLLVHSINAAASAYEVRPLFERYAAGRRVYAPDLPGYGHSDRSDRPYTPRLMTDALHAMAAEIRRLHGAAPFDALALSLSCEFAARAAREAPGTFRTLALVSPTGFNRARPSSGAPGSTRGLGAVLAVLRTAGVGRGLFRLLVTERSIRFFLGKTFGAKVVDPGLVAYDVLTTRQPGAEHAPLHFLSGFLFSGDVSALYDALDLPVWMSHGVRGDFTDYRYKRVLASKPNWRFTVFETGALPYFEVPDRFCAEYDAFLAAPRG